MPYAAEALHFQAFLHWHNCWEIPAASLKENQVRGPTILNPQKQYTTITELLADENFLGWYFNKEHCDNHLLNEWLGIQEQNRCPIEAAVQLLDLITQPGMDGLGDDDAQASFDRMVENMQELFPVPLLLQK